MPARAQLSQPYALSAPGHAAVSKGWFCLYCAGLRPPLTPLSLQAEVHLLPLLPGTPLLHRAAVCSGRRPG